MKTFFCSILPIALLLVFIGCSNNNENNEGGGGGDNSDVKVSTDGKNVDQILQSAVNELKKENWDEAVAYYNAAYDKDNNNPKAIIYSVMANLAKISTDPKVMALMKEHFGFTTYPNKLNALLSDSWMKEYKDEYENCYYDRNWNWRCTTEYDNISLPVIRTPAWVQGKGSAYNDALLSGNVMSLENWAISLLANVIDKNSNGFNPLLDDVIDGVFGASFNLAVERLKKLESKKESRIKLDPYFIEKLDLEDVFDESDQIGWAEVNTVLSAMLLVKASLEWVQSYDLSTDLNWLKYSWKEDESDILNHFKNVDANKLPFNNSFFKVRPGKMANSQADYVKAVKGFQSSYSSIINSDLYPSKLRESYNTINGGFDELIKAINNGGKFYIPENPTKGTWPTSKNGNVEATIDLGKFFTEGYFSLQNIFETNAGKPVFYLTYNYYSDDDESGSNCHYEEYWDDYWEEYDYEWVCDEPTTKPAKPETTQLTKSNYASLISEGGHLALAVKTGQFKAIADINDIDESEFEYLPIGLSGDAAKAVFEKYYP